MSGRPPPPPPDDYYYQGQQANYYQDSQPDYYRQEPPRRPKKRRRNMGGIIAPIVVLLILFMLLFSPLGDMLFGNIWGAKYSARSDFTVTRTMNIQVDNGEIEYWLDIPRPTDLSGPSGTVQEVHSVTTAPTTTQVFENGTTWLTWSDVTTQDVSIQTVYDMTVHTQLWEISPAQSGMQNDIPQSLVDSQTGNEWEITRGNNVPTGEYRIWPSNSQIQNLAATLTSETATVIENVESIYRYLRSELTYYTGSSTGPKSCLQTLSDGYGDCDDQSIVLISLCRAIDIPSWLVFGALHDRSTGDWGGHAWAEIYIPMADGGGEEVTIDIVNGEFLVRNCNRFEEWKSDGISQHLENYYYLLTHRPTGNYPFLNVVYDETYTGPYTASSETVGWIAGISSELILATAEK